MGTLGFSNLCNRRSVEFSQLSRLLLYFSITFLSRRIAMASISGSRRALETRSGGKIVRPRRTIGPKTPYDRPQPRFTKRPHENPNWLFKLILSPTRVVVSGAGKLISAVFSSADSSSSSSSSSSGFNSDSVDVIKDDYDGVSSQFADRLQKRDGASRMIERFRKDFQPMVEKNDNKCEIEQLLKQETFTREECNKLIRIIKSRVLDHHATWSATQSKRADWACYVDSMQVGIANHITLHVKRMKRAPCVNTTFNLSSKIGQPLSPPD